MRSRLTAYTTLLLLVFSTNFLFAQQKNSAYVRYIKRSASHINIDGIMDEDGWLQAEVATKFYMVLPMDTSLAKVNTEVRMTYDNENLYLMATCFHGKQKYMVESLRRDFVFGKN